MTASLRLPPRRPDRFEEWLSVAVPEKSPDPRVDVRRAHPSEFAAIYDLVDETFGFKQPRTLYDWLYRRNPDGLARCWVMVERATRRFVGAVATCPWPAAYGGAALAATLRADFVIATDWQRQGLNRVRGHVADSHPWEQTTIRLGWPNQRSRAVIGRTGIDGHVLGPLPRRVLALRTTTLLAKRGWPRPLATVVGGTADRTLAAWNSIVLGRQFSGTIEPVQRFDSAVDAVTARCTAADGYWFPHDAEFLNWRYHRHPTREYLAFAAVIGSAPVGYCVVQIGGPTAWLMEFAVPTEQPPVGRALLLRAITAARDAGCMHMEVCALPHWPHWPLMRVAGFVKARGSLYMYVWDPCHREAVQLDRWQFTLGDVDRL